MKLVPAEEIFNVEMPKTLVFGHQKPYQEGTNFVTTKGTDNGVAGRVEPIQDRKTYPSLAITVPTNGTVMASYVQTEEFYCAHQIAVMTPHDPTMPLQERLFYSACFRANASRYGYGRKADRTIRKLLVPDRSEVPDWARTPEALALRHPAQEELRAELHQQSAAQAAGVSDLVPLEQIFDVKYGSNLELNKQKHDPDGIAFVARSSKNNGITSRIQAPPEITALPAGGLTVAVSGSVLETFLQTEPYLTSHHIMCLTARTEMTTAEKLYYCAAIKQNASRYNYGRQANRTLRQMLLPAPWALPGWLQDAGLQAIDQEGARFS